MKNVLIFVLCTILLSCATSKYPVEKVELIPMSTGFHGIKIPEKIIAPVNPVKNSVIIGKIPNIN